MLPFAAPLNFVSPKAVDKYGVLGAMTPENPDWPHAPEAPQATSAIGQLLAGAYNGAIKPAADFMAAPAGIGSLGVGGMPAMAQKGVAALFAPLAFKNAEEARQRANEAWNDPNSSLQDKVTPLADAVSQGLMGVGAARHAIPKPNFGRLGIVPEGVSGLPSQDARFAELEARAKAGDQAALAEAQAMTDARAKEAGAGANYSDSANTAWEGTQSNLARSIQKAQSDAERAAKFIAENPDKAGTPLFRVAENSLKRSQDLAAEAQKSLALGQPPLTLHHGTDTAFNTFRTKDGGRSLWMTDSGEVAGTYGKNLMNLYARMETPLIHDAKGANYQNLEFEGNRLDADDLSSIARDRGHDGLVIKRLYDSNTSDGGSVMSDHYTVFTPQQIKLADAFTYDDAGNLIPLSQRFNWQNPDIRYMAPAALGLGALGLGALNQGNGQQ